MRERSKVGKKRDRERTSLLRTWRCCWTKSKAQCSLLVDCSMLLCALSLEQENRLCQLR